MKIRRLLARLGPGFITGAADDDPAGIGTYSQTGAAFGYGQLWLVLFTVPFMVVIQEMCGRIGLVTGRGFSSLIRRHYSKRLLVATVALLAVANVINIGADLGAMAASVRLVTGLPAVVSLVLMTVLILVTAVFVRYRPYARILKYLALTLLAYVATAFIVRQDWGQIARATFIPRIDWSREYLLNVVALLGTTISPYLFFWQASEEVEEVRAEQHLPPGEGSRRPRVRPGDMHRLEQDTILGMVFSQAVTFFIILTAASTLYAHGVRTVDTATQAASALRPLAGQLAYLLFTLGIVGTGLLAIPVLAGSAAYAVAGALKWKEGLDRRWRETPGFYGVLAAATIVGMLLDFVGVNPMRALYYSAAVNGLIAPPLMVVILRMANDRRIMGRYTNGPAQNVLGGIVTLVMGLASLLLIGGLIAGG